MSSFKPVAPGEIKLKWNTETVSASPAYFSTRRNCFRVLFQGCADSRVRTSLKLKSNKTVDGRLKRSPDRRQFCFISVLFHHVRRALVLQERTLVYDRRWLAAALYHNTLQSDHRRRISASDNSVSSAWSSGSQTLVTLVRSLWRICSSSLQCSKFCFRHVSKSKPMVPRIDVKNINLQIKNIKTCFFTFIKTLKNMHKNIKLQYSLK